MRNIIKLKSLKGCKRKRMVFKIYNQRRISIGMICILAAIVQTKRKTAKYDGHLKSINQEIRVNLSSLLLKKTKARSYFYAQHLQWTQIYEVKTDEQNSLLEKWNHQLTVCTLKTILHNICLLWAGRRKIYLARLVVSAIPVPVDDEIDS